MERTKLKEAREAKDLEQQDVADAIGCSRESISLWERGEVDPQDHWITELCKFFSKSPEQLDLVSRVSAQNREGQIAVLQKKLNRLNPDRREVLELISGLSVFAGLDLSKLFAMLEAPSTIVPEDFLDQCNAGINACWHLMKHDGLAHVQSILTACLPTLSELANRPSDYQHLAASLAMQAKTLQGILAMHRLDYISLEIYIAAAARYGRMSGNTRLLVTSLGHQGKTYTHHFPAVKRAMGLFNEGMGLLDRDALLNKASLSIELASAYALDGNEDKAIEMVKQARATMPEHPEVDPLYHIIDFGLADLDRVEGRVYLALAENMHSGDYAEKAYHAFSQGTSKQATSDRSWSQTLIHQADAVLALGDFREFANCMEQGLIIALQIDSKKRKQEALTVLGKVPEEWQKEEKYQKFVKMF